jgi:hypothetical protein
MKVALFIGSHEKDSWDVRLGCWLTRIVQRGNYSRVTHCEAILDEFPDGTVNIASASLRDGGVRQKRVTLTPGDWIIKDKPEWDVEKARLWFTAHNGEKYDLRGAFVCFLPFWWSTKNQWFCNQAVGAPFLDSPEIFTPSQFASIVLSP